MMSQFLLTVNIPCGDCFVQLAANEMKIWSTLVKHRHKRVFVVPFFFLFFFFIYVFCEDLKRIKATLEAISELIHNLRNKQTMTQTRLPGK